MSAKLRVTSPSGDSFELSIGDTAMIGRSEDNTVCLRASPLASRQHAFICCHDGNHYQLSDLGSRNGTFLNDRRLTAPVMLKNGARIRIADHVIVFEQGPQILQPQPQISEVPFAVSTTHIARPQRWDVPFGSSMTEEDVDRLLTVAPFSTVDPTRFPVSIPFRGILLNDTRIRQFESGEIIVREGDYGNSAFFILDGAVNSPSWMLYLRNFWVGANRRKKASLVLWPSFGHDLATPKCAIIPVQQQRVERRARE